MNRKSQWKHWLLSGVAAGAITLTVLGAAPQLAFAQSTPAAPAQGSDATTPAQPASPLRGRGAADTDRSQTLADALGITVDELNAARDAARDAALDQAVAEGLLTQEQADAIRNGEGRGLGIRMPRGQESSIDMDALLADALGITVDELDAAEQAAREAGLAQAVADGVITQEQADLMAARGALKEFARDGEYASLEEAAQAAVDAGVLTQEQADLILSAPQSERHGGRGMRGHHGGPDGDDVTAPQGSAPTAPADENL